MGEEIVMNSTKTKDMDSLVQEGFPAFLVENSLVNF